MRTQNAMQMNGFQIVVWSLAFGLWPSKQRNSDCDKIKGLRAKAKDQIATAIVIISCSPLIPVVLCTLFYRSGALG
jgi:hypothetical protein